MNQRIRDGAMSARTERGLCQWCGIKPSWLMMMRFAATKE
jgi:hypothetical protein